MESVSGTETYDRTTGNRTNSRGDHDQKRKAHAILSRGVHGVKACGGSQKEGESSTANTARPHVSRSAEEDES
jgi:hypothetical protein